MGHVPSVWQLYVAPPRVLGCSLVHYLASLRAHVWMCMHIHINIWKPLASRGHRTMSIPLSLIILLSYCTPDSALGILQLNPGKIADKWPMQVVFLYGPTLTCGFHNFNWGVHFEIQHHYSSPSPLRLLSLPYLLLLCPLEYLLIYFVQGSAHVEVRGKLARTGSLLPPCGF